MIGEDIKSWQSKVDLLELDIEKFISEHPLPEIVSFSTAGTRKGLYEAYANIVNVANEITPYLVEVQKAYLRKSSFKKVIRELRLSNTLIVELNKVVEEVSEKVVVLDRMLNSYKISVENQLRFYQSVQYILSSPRLNSYD